MVEPASPVDEYQRPHLLMGQIDNVAVTGGVAAVTLDDAGGHQVIDDGPELLWDVLQVLM